MADMKKVYNDLMIINLYQISFCDLLWKHELYYIPVLQIANQDSEIIYYVYGMIAKLFVLSLNTKDQMNGVEKVFFEHWSVEWHFNFSEYLYIKHNFLPLRC